MRAAMEVLKRTQVISDNVIKETVKRYGLSREDLLEMAKKNDRLRAHFSQNKMTAGYWKSLGLGGKAPRFRVEGTS